MIVLSLMISCIVFCLFSQKKGIFSDPYTFFFISFLYYGYFVPVVMYITGDYNMSFSVYRFILIDRDINIVSYILVFSFILFSVGYRLGDWVSPSAQTARFAARRGGGLSSEGDFRFVIFALLCVILIGSLFFGDEFIEIYKGYAEKIDVRYGNSLFNFFYKFSIYIIVIFSIYVISFSKKPTKWFIIFFSIFSIFPFILFSKELFVFSALILFSYLNRIVNRFQILVLFLFIISIVVFLLIFMPMFSFYRATRMIEFVSPSELDLTIIYSDALGPFSVLISALWGQTPAEYVSLFQSFFLWLPRVIWSTRPLDVAEEFARFFMVNWQEGHGLGFSILAEGVMRFGVILSPVMMMIGGFVFGLLKSMFYLALPSRIAFSIGIAVISHMMFQVMRAPFSAVFSLMLQFWIPFLLLLVLYHLLHLLLAKSSPARITRE